MLEVVLIESLRVGVVGPFHLLLAQHRLAPILWDPLLVLLLQQRLPMELLRSLVVVRLVKRIYLSLGLDTLVE